MILNYRTVKPSLTAVGTALCLHLCHNATFKVRTLAVLPTRVKRNEPFVYLVAVQKLLKKSLTLLKKHLAVSTALDLGNSIIGKHRCKIEASQPEITA